MDYVAEHIAYTACRQLVREFRNRNREVARSDAYFDWRYNGKNYGAGAPEAFVSWMFDRARNAIAAVSVIPHQFALLGSPAFVGLVGDISVVPHHHGQGLATRLLRAAVDRAAEAGLAGCFVMPNVDVVGALSRAGFQRSGVLQRYVLPLSLERRFAGASKPVRLLGRLCEPGLQFAHRFAGRASTGSYGVDESGSPPAALDELWRYLDKSRMNIAARDVGHLRWRYGAGSGVPFRFLVLVEAKQALAYAVFHEHAGTVYIADMLARTPRLGQAVLAELIRRSLAIGRAHTLQVSCSHTPAAYLPQPGWLWSRRPDEQTYMYASCATSPQALAQNWFVTSGDKDV